MIEHPWKILSRYLEENGYTQKAFSIKINKKVSEINELIKWKRNITIAWDMILSDALQTPQKFWILKQLEYDYDQAIKNEESKKELKKNQIENENMKKIFKDF